MYISFIASILDIIGLYMNEIYWNRYVYYNRDYRMFLQRIYIRKYKESEKDSYQI